MSAVPDDLAYQARRVARLGMPAGRDMRIVHEIDGILSPVLPQALLHAGGALWSQWTQHPQYTAPGLLLGLDAGGILPTVAVALASGLPYRLAWKLDLDLPAKRRFTEPHARRTDVYTYGNLTGTRVLIIDDEVTTGQTIANLAAVLRDAGAAVTGAACLVEDNSGGARSRLQSAGIPLCALTRL